MTGWYVPRGRRLLWYERDGEAVVFNRQSGKTHYLNTLASEVLHRFEAAPQSVADVVAHLNAIWDGDPDDEMDRHVQALTEAFVHQGLIDPWPG